MERLLDSNNGRDRCLKLGCVVNTDPSVKPDRAGRSGQHLFNQGARRLNGECWTTHTPLNNCGVAERVKKHYVAEPDMVGTVLKLVVDHVTRGSIPRRRNRGGPGSGTEHAPDPVRLEDLETYMRGIGWMRIFSLLSFGLKSIQPRLFKSEDNRAVDPTSIASRPLGPSNERMNDGISVLL